MKNFLLFLFLLCFSLSGGGCAFFGERADEGEESVFEDSGADDGMGDEESGEEMDDEESEDGEEGEYEGEEEEDGEDEYDEEEEEGEYDEEDGAEEEEGESGGFFGFFKGLFGGGEDDDSGDYGDEGEDFGDGGDFAEGGDSEEDLPASQPGGSEYSGGGSSSPAPPGPGKISVKKIKTAPYRRGSHLVNAVYIARGGDSIETVSQRIYQSDRSEELYSINPHFRSRGLKVGDKVYYNSPSRPSDSSQLLVYYQDAGAEPSSHNISAGQNIRKVASQLLGHPDSWKEIWATNQGLQSKGVVQQDIAVQYWPDRPPASEEPPAPVAAPPSEPAPPSDGGMPPDDGSAGEEPGLPPDDGSAGEEPGLPPDEPPLEGAEPPLPGGPEEPMPGEEPSEEPPEEKDESEQEKTIVQIIFSQKKLLFGSLAFLGFIMLMLKVIISKRRKNGEFDYTSTNIVKA